MRLTFDDCSDCPIRLVHGSDVLVDDTPRHWVPLEPGEVYSLVIGYQYIRFTAPDDSLKLSELMVRDDLIDRSINKRPVDLTAAKALSAKVRAEVENPTTQEEADEATDDS